MKIRNELLKLMWVALYLYLPMIINWVFVKITGDGITRESVAWIYTLPLIALAGVFVFIGFYKGGKEE